MARAGRDGQRTRLTDGEGGRGPCHLPNVVGVRGVLTPGWLAMVALLFRGRLRQADLPPPMLRGSMLMWRLAALVLLPAPVLAQVCGPGAAPTYADLANALDVPGLGLDTLSIRGDREFTVVLGDSGAERGTVLGAPTERSIASATAWCRVAALWTSRGDSLAVNWLLAPQEAELSVVNLTARSLSLEDRPRPGAYADGSSLQLGEVARGLITSFGERAAGDIGRGRTDLLVMVDSTGRPVISRILSSSGRRTLDQAALTAAMLDTPGTGSDSVGTAVSRWYVVPISWTEGGPGGGGASP